VTAYTNVSDGQNRRSVYSDMVLIKAGNGSAFWSA